MNTNGTDPPTIDPPPTVIYDCTLGQIATRAARHTEIDPAALMLCLAATIGATIGPGPHTWFGEERHPALIWVALVGPSGVARKSTTIKRALKLVSDVDPAITDRIISGLGSGEALADAFRPTNPGDRHDPRCIIREHELARILRVCRREGSTLSAMLRDAWDGHRLETRTRTAGTVTVTDHHIALLAAITPTELRTCIDDTLLQGGFANRVLWVPVPPGRPHLKLRPDIPEPGSSPLTPIIHHARRRAEIPFSGEALQHLTERYGTHRRQLDLLDDTPLAAIHARHWPHTVRLALVICLCDQATHISEQHLVIAETLVTWCEQTLRVALRAPCTGDPIADRIVQAVRARGTLTRTELTRDVFGGHLRTDTIERALLVAEQAGLLRRDRTPSGNGRGRPAEQIHPA